MYSIYRHGILMGERLRRCTGAETTFGDGCSRRPQLALETPTLETLELDNGLLSVTAVVAGEL